MIDLVQKSSKLIAAPSRLQSHKRKYRLYFWNDWKFFFFSSKVLNTRHCIKKWKKRACFPPEAVMNEWKGRGGMSGNVTSGLWRNRNGWDTAARLRKKIESTFTRLMWYFMLKMVFSNLSIHVITIYSSSTWSQKINSIRRIGHKNGKFLPKSWTNISMVRMGVPKRGSKI